MTAFHRSTSDPPIPQPTSIARVCARIAAILIGIGSVVYAALPLPYTAWVVGLSVVLAFVLFFFPKKLPSIFSFQNISFPIVFVVPFLGVVLAALHRLLGLRGGLILQIGIICGGVGLAILLATNLFFTRQNTFSSLFNRLLPLSAAYLAFLLIFFFWTQDRLKLGVVLGAIVLSIPFVLYVWNRFGAYGFLGLTFFILAIWPLVADVPKFNWVMGGWGVLLLFLAIYRKAPQGLPIHLSPNSVYFLSVIYLLWLCFTFLFVDIPTKTVFLKILLVAGQIVFILGIFENLRSKKDVWACAIGYGLGAALVLLLMYVDVMKKLTSFNPLLFLVFGLRATVGGHSPNVTASPLVILALMAFAYLIQNPLKTQQSRKVLWAIFLACLIGIFFSGSRSNQLGLFAALFVLSAKAPLYRKWLIFGGFTVLLGVIAGYLFAPQVTEILLRLRSMDSGRLMLWSVAWEAILESPLVGYGPTANFTIFQQLVMKYYVGELWRGGGTHNLFFSETLETGFIGFLLYAAVLYAVWLWIKNSPQKDAVPWRMMGVGIFVAFLMRGLFESNLLLFIHSSLGFCYPHILAMVLASGERLTDAA